MKTYLSSLVLTALFMTTAFQAQAVSEKLAPLFWPDTKLIPIQVGSKDVVSDGLEFTINEFQNAVLPFYTSSMSDWKYGSQLSYRNGSVVFNYTRNPSIKTAVSLIRSSDWLPQLDSESLDRYVASLQNLHKNRFTLLNADTDYAPIFASGFLLGNPYKLLNYEIKPEDPNLPTLVFWDLIAKEDDNLIVLSVECPKSLADRNSSMPLVFLTTLARLEDMP